MPSQNDNTVTVTPSIFRLPVPLQIRKPESLLQSTGRELVGLAERVLNFDKFNQVYQNIDKSDDVLRFVQSAIDELGVGFNVTSEDRDRIPQNGPLVVVANHPFGIVDPLGMIELVRQKRSDFKILTNRMLATVPELASLCIFVDPQSNSKAAKENFRGMSEAIRWLKSGGAIGVFPAGEVASFDLAQARIVERAWTMHLARLIRMSKASSLPIYFHGTNSLTFHLSGLIHPLLRTALLPRESLIKHDTSIPVVVGNPINFRRLAGFDDDRAMVEFLRQRTLILSRRLNEKKTLPRTSGTFLKPVLAKPRDEQLLKEEIESLPIQQRLIQLGDFQVYFASAEQIPNALLEIGRLREITFREVGEGSGKEEDLDQFDNYYVHLFIWQSAKAELVGAYRLGKTDEILSRLGGKGLYTSTLFKFHPSLLRELNPALELGRSWVRKEYQKSSIALALLWRGIGAFVVLHPQYHRLFGPVSISNEYRQISHQLMIHFIRRNFYHDHFSRRVRSYRPFTDQIPLQVRKDLQIENIEDLSSIVSDIEIDGKGVPILLKEYLKLGGKILGFNIDKDFGNVVDGLIMVDLLETELKLLERYLGKEGAQNFYLHHRKA